MTLQIRIRRFLKLALFLSYLLSVEEVYSQDNLTDSLKRELQTAKADTNKVYILLQLSRPSRDNKNVDIQFQYANEALLLADKLNFIKGRANAFWRISFLHIFQQNYPQALQASFKALKLFEELGDVNGVIKCYSDITFAYLSQNDFSEALKYKLRKIKLLENNENAISSIRDRQDLSDIYFMMANYDDALKTNLINLNRLKEVNNEFLSSQLLSRTLSQLARDYKAQGDVANSAGDKATAARKYDEAIVACNQAIEALKKFPNAGISGEIYWHLGSVYSKLNNYDIAKDYFEKALKLLLSTGFAPKMIISTYESLSFIDSAQGYYQKSLENYKAYIRNKEREINDSSVKKTFQAKVQYEFDKKEDSLRLQQQITDEKLKQERLLSIQQQQELKINEASLKLSNQQKELNRLAFLGSEAQLQAEQSQRKEKEKQLTLVEKEKALQDANLKLKISELGLRDKEVRSKKIERNIFLAGALSLLIVGLMLWRNNRNKQKAYALLKTQKMETDLQRERVEATLAELKATQSQLIQSEKMASLGELTAGIAHEIQNPLNFVNNFSEVSTELVDEMNAEIKKGNEQLAMGNTQLAIGNMQTANEIAKDLKQNLEKINHHGKRAGDIVKGMLQHSRSSSGVKEPTDINKLADEYLRLAYHGLRAKDKSFNATMKTDFDETIGNINIIPQDIGRVMVNLINNAFYAVDEKKKQVADGYEPTVIVSTKKLDNKIEVKVKDNGNGIPQKVLDKIFQPFFTTKPTGQGTGLGLSLSYDIVKAHGGEIKVETKEGEGTVFTIVLAGN
jgi:two-component system NtrC family sensor kinase